MIEPEFLVTKIVHLLHDEALGRYGGVPGLKDEGMLLSALSRPMNKLAYAEAGSIDLFDLAAAYAYGLAANHPFNDGNKRTAWASCLLFLKVNSVEIEASVEAVTERMPLLVSREMNESAFAAWLRTRTRTISGAMR